MTALPFRLHVFLALALLTALSGCERRFTLQFAAQVGGQPLRCGTTYENIGARGSRLELLDFKAYVRDVTLVRANGERWPLRLKKDGRWQRDTYALLDFEDGSGACNTGSPEVHTEVVGVTRDFDDFTGVELTLGLPSDVNHLNAAWAEPPLDDVSMWWSWKTGYKFLRLDVRADGNTAYAFHVGADGCEGSPDEGITCAARNQAVISLQGFDPDHNRIVFDLAALFAHTQFDQADGVTDLVAGCLSDARDPECPPLMQQVGLGEGAAPTGPDAFIRVE